ncbi:MAG: hypothetical protein ABIP13_06995 [Tepidiformaceae bacterium]
MDNRTTVQPFDWGAIAALDQEGQNSAVFAAYSAMADTDETNRRAALRSAIDTIYGLPDANLRSLTEARLRSWLAMPPESAALVGNSFEAAMDEMPARIAMRRVTVVQSVAFAFPAEELARLQKLVPRVLGDTPLPVPKMSKGTPSKRPWWKFGQKS